MKKATEGFSEILLYTTQNGKAKVEIYLQDETIWLTQQKIADLFGVQRLAITKHPKDIFETRNSVNSILEHATPHGAMEGKTQEAKVKYYRNINTVTRYRAK
ncbi:MAG: hypothetical protein ABI325_03795 [Ginsengibacter sp.]